MIQVQFMKPFYTKVSDGKLRLVFAYQYFSILKDGEEFHFIPIESKEMIIDLETCNVENLSDVFVFQRGNRFVRLPLYQLLLVSNVHDYLIDIIGSNNNEHKGESSNQQERPSGNIEVDQIVKKLTQQNFDQLINQALDEKNEKKFNELIAMKNAVL